MNPFDDLHRFHRPAALVATCLTGDKIENMLEWLHPKYNSAAESEFSEADMNTFKAFGVEPPKRS